MRGDVILIWLIVYPLLGAVLTYLVGRKWKNVRDYMAMFITITELLAFVWLFAKMGVSQQEYQFVWSGFCGKGMFLTLDPFRVLFGGIAAFMWMMTMLFSREYFTHYRNRNRYYFFQLLTLGATVGVFLSADLYTTFLFFEMMSLTSYVGVVQDERQESIRAGETYLAIAIIGGLVMLMGLFLLQHSVGTLEMKKLLEACQTTTSKNELYIAGACLLFGFGAKAGAFPLHIWLPKAHPVAPAPASALLSGILTKTGIFGILVISTTLFFQDTKWGRLLLVIGLTTMLLGAILALFSLDLKRVLACSSISQIGFILTGIGMQGLLGENNSLAVAGTVLHMVNHSLLKLVLFLTAGVVFYNIHELDLNKIQGFGRKKPVLHFTFLMGTLGITGVPLWNGYLSKTLLHESIIEYIALVGEHAALGYSVLGGKLAEIIFLLSGGITVAYMMKLYSCLFLQKNKDLLLQEQYEDKTKPYCSKLTCFSLIGSAILLPVIGLFVHPLVEEGVSYFQWEAIKGSLISILIGAILFVLFVQKCLMHKDNTTGKRQYRNLWPEWLDLENLIFRPLLLNVLPFVGAVFARICDSLVDMIVIFLRKTIYQDRKLPHELEEGNAFTYAVGSLLDRFTAMKHKIAHTNKPQQVSYVHKLALIRETQMENNTLIGRSLSFGLFMFCFGLCLTLIYLLFL